VIYDDIIGSADHKIKAGASLLALQIEQFAAQPNGEMLIGNLRTEWVPGVFAEYAYSGNRLSAVVGARFDQHNLAGAQFSPRAHLKYALSPQLDLRLTGGRAWRLPNFVMDNLSLLASSKTWIVNQALLPEISWNVGASLVQGFSFKKRKGSLSLDAYHTRFSQQLVADRDTLSGMVVFKNLSANSVATVVQAEFAYAVLPGLDLRLAYKFQDVRALYNGKLQTQVLLPRQRIFANIGYQTRNKRWAHDLTYSRYSAVRLPQGGQGQAWGLLNAQVTRNWKQLELYVGGENLLNVMQHHPIVAAQNPFGPDFDATEIWAPIMGWNAYLGLRYTIK
jgi:outer membrane receptor protein involved in Fe transport